MRVRTSEVEGMRVRRGAPPVRASERVVVSGTKAGRKIGVLGLDLGGTSGLAWWTGTLQGGIKDTLVGGDFGFTQVYCGNGDVVGERAGAEAMALLFRDLDFKWTLAGIPVADHQIACEEFTLRGAVGSTARVGLASARLASLLEGMLVSTASAEQWHRYQPSRSKSFASSERLKKWELWCRSMPHARDAAKQVAIHVATMLEQ